MFSVMTWNVENLFVPAANDPQNQRDRFDQKLALLAATINALSPDVIALQELGPRALGRLQNTLGSGAYPAAHEGVPGDRGIRVGVLSRLAFQGPAANIVNFTGPPPIDQIQGLDNAGAVVSLNRLGRGAVRVTVNADGTTAHIITCHLKSKLLTFPGGVFSTNDEGLRARVGAIALMRRAAEAAQVRLVASQLMAQHPDDGVIVLGDLNDSPSAATSQLLLGPSGSEIGTLGFNIPDEGDRTRLFNTAPRISEDRRYSRRHRGTGELLDQIFASEELFPRDNGQRRLPTVDSHVDFADGLPSVTDNPNVRSAEIAPDHAPVTASFELA